jgi:glycosyltransferase involved in cell wall biosynthesis
MTESYVPLVSIAMCTYNGERFLREQLNSLIAQDYPNLELIVVDDKSTDSTFDILQEYEKKYPYIHTIQNDKNIGFVRNFEKAIQHCTGEYIALCDQDDIWFPHKITTLVNNIGDAGLIYSQVKRINENGTLLDKDLIRSNSLEGKCHLNFLFKSGIPGHLCLMKKEVLSKALPFPEGISFHDRWIIFITAALCGIKAYPEVLSLHRKHGKNAALGINSRSGRSKCAKQKQQFSECMTFLNAVLKSDCLSPEDRRLIEQVREAYSKFPRCYSNRKLRKILIEHRDQLLQVYKDEQTAIKRLCYGLWKYRLRKFL